MADIQKQAQMYYTLIHEGMSPKDAFNKAFPDGIPTAQDRAKEAAKGNQQAAIGQIGGVLVGALGTKYLVDKVPELLGSQVVQEAGKEAIAQGTAEVVSGTATGGGFGGGASGAEAVAAEGIGIAPYLGAAGAALGAYGVHNAIEANDPKAGAISGAGMGLGLGAAAPLIGLGPIGWGGLALAAALGAGGGAGLTSLFGHESTRDVAKRHTKDLMQQGQDNPAWQNYVAGMREQHNFAPPDPSKPFHGGQYATWDEYKNAGLDAADLTGVYGNLKTFGPEWANLSFDQRKDVTQALINADLYNSKKGEVVVTDADLARQVAAPILSGGTPIQSTKMTTPAQVRGATLAAALAPRSSTLSPGIDKHGRRIAY